MRHPDIQGVPRLRTPPLHQGDADHSAASSRGPSPPSPPRPPRTHERTHRRARWIQWLRPYPDSCCISGAACCPVPPPPRRHVPRSELPPARDTPSQSVSRSTLPCDPSPNLIIERQQQVVPVTGSPHLPSVPAAPPTGAVRRAGISYLPRLPRHISRRASSIH